jgi:hypothetical protein
MTATAWGAHQDIVIASVESMLNGINNILSKENASNHPFSIRFRLDGCKMRGEFNAEE